MELLCDLVVGQHPAAPHRVSSAVVVGNLDRLPSEPAETLDSEEAAEREVGGIVSELEDERTGSVFGGAATL
jgi:hypothetical protein